MTLTLDTTQAERAVRRFLSPVPLVVITTYTDLGAETVDEVFYLSDRGVRYGWENAGTDRLFLPWLAETRLPEVGIDHLPDPQGGGAFNAEAEITLHNMTWPDVPGQSRVIDLLRAHNLEGASLVVAEVLLDRQPAYYPVDLRSLNGFEHTVRYRGQVTRVAPTENGFVTLRARTDVAQISWLVQPSNDERANGGRVPKIYGARKSVPLFPHTVGASTTLSGALAIGAGSATVSDASGFSSSGSAMVEGEKVTWTSKTQLGTGEWTLNSLSRAQTSTEEQHHGSGSRVVELVTSAVWLAADHPCKAIDAIYALSPFNGEKVRVDSDLFDIDLADAVTVSGETVTSVTLPSDSYKGLSTALAAQAEVTQQPSFGGGLDAETTETEVSPTLIDSKTNVLNASNIRDNNTGTSCEWTGSTDNGLTVRFDNDALNSGNPYQFNEQHIELRISQDGTSQKKLKLKQGGDGGPTVATIDPGDLTVGVWTSILTTSSNEQDWKLNQDGVTGTNFMGAEIRRKVDLQNITTPSTPQGETQIAAGAFGSELKIFGDIQGYAIPASPAAALGAVLESFEDTARTWNEAPDTSYFTTVDEVTTPAPIPDGARALKIEGNSDVEIHDNGSSDSSNWTALQQVTISGSADVILSADSASQSSIAERTGIDSAPVDLTGLYFSMIVDFIGYGGTGDDTFTVRLQTNSTTWSEWDVTADLDAVIVDSNFYIDPTATPDRTGASALDITALNDIRITFNQINRDAARRADVNDFFTYARNSDVWRAQYNSPSTLGDWSSSAGYEMALYKIDTGTNTFLAGIEVYFSDEIETGTTLPSAYRSVVLTSDYASETDSAWLTKVDAAPVDTGSPTVVAVRTLGVNLIPRTDLHLDFVSHQFDPMDVQPNFRLDALSTRLPAFERFDDNTYTWNELNATAQGNSNQTASPAEGVGYQLMSMGDEELHDATGDDANWAVVSDCTIAPGGSSSTEISASSAVADAIAERIGIDVASADITDHYVIFGGGSLHYRLEGYSGTGNDTFTVRLQTDATNWSEWDFAIVDTMEFLSFIVDYRVTPDATGSGGVDITDVNDIRVRFNQLNRSTARKVEIRQALNRFLNDTQSLRWQYNAAGTLGDWAAESYWIWRRQSSSDTYGFMDEMFLYFSDEVETGTTLPSAYRELTISDDLSALPGTFEDVNVGQGSDVGSPTLAAVRTLGFRATIRAGQHGIATELFAPGSHFTYWDALREGGTVSSYVGTEGAVLEHPADIFRHTVQVLMGATIDETAQTAYVAAVGSLKLDADVRAVLTMEDWLALLGFNARGNIHCQPRANSCEWAIYAADLTVAGGGDYDFAFAAGSGAAWEGWAGVSDAGRDLKTEWASRYTFFYDYDAALGLGEEGFKGSIRVAASQNDLSPKVPTADLSAAETARGVRERVPLAFLLIHDPATAEEVAAYYVREGVRIGSVFGVEGLHWAHSYALEPGDIRKLTPPWSSTEKDVRILTVRRDGGRVDVRAVEVLT